MLNKNDLKKIGEIINSNLEQRLKPVHDQLQEHGKMLKSHGKMLKSLKKDQDTMLNMLDREQMDQKKRIKRIEEHFDLPPLVV